MQILNGAKCKIHFKHVVSKSKQKILKTKQHSLCLNISLTKTSQSFSLLSPLWVELGFFQTLIVILPSTATSNIKQGKNQKIMTKIPGMGPPTARQRCSLAARGTSSRWVRSTRFCHEICCHQQFSSDQRFQPPPLSPYYYILKTCRSAPTKRWTPTPPPHIGGTKPGSSGVSNSHRVVSAGGFFWEKVEKTHFEFVRTLMVMYSAWRRARLGSKQILEESKMAKMMREGSTSATCLARPVGKKTAYFSVR